MMSRCLWKVGYPRHVSKPFAAYVCLNPEESGNMVIMTLSYYQRTGDSSLMTTYVSTPAVECAVLRLTSEPDFSYVPVRFAGPMDPVPDHRCADPREPDQHGRLCWQPSEPDQSGDQGHRGHQSDGGDRIDRR